MGLSDRDYMQTAHSLGCACQDCMEKRQRVRRQEAFDPRFAPTGELNHRFVSKPKGEKYKELEIERAGSVGKLIVSIVGIAILVGLLVFCIMAKYLGSSIP